MTSIKWIYIFIISLLSISTIPLSSQNVQDFQEGQYVYISSPAGLNMRDQPSIDGNKVTALTYNSKIMILEVSDSVEDIQGKTSKWILTSYNSKSGWIFGGFVSNHLIGNISDEFRYYLSNGRSESYSIHMGMKLSDVYKILGNPNKTVGFMGQQVHIYKNPFLNIYGDNEIDEITWADESCGVVFGLLPEVTTEDGIISIIGKPDEIEIIEPDSDGEAVNVGKNFIYRESGYKLLINITLEGFIDYISLKRE